MVFSPLLFCEVDHPQYFFWRWRIETTGGLPAVAVVFMCQQGTFKVELNISLKLFEIFGMIFDTEGVVVVGGHDFVPPISVLRSLLRGHLLVGAHLWRLARSRFLKFHAMIRCVICQNGGTAYRILRASCQSKSVWPG